MKLGRTNCTDQGEGGEEGGRRVEKVSVLSEMIRCIPTACLIVYWERTSNLSFKLGRIGRKNSDGRSLNRTNWTNSPFLSFSLSLALSRSLSLFSPLLDLVFIWFVFPLVIYREGENSRLFWHTRQTNKSSITSLSFLNVKNKNNNKGKQQIALFSPLTPSQPPPNPPTLVSTWASGRNYGKLGWLKILFLQVMFTH